MTKPLSLQSPTLSDGRFDHADWLEALALQSADLNSSLEDLVSALRIGGSVDVAGARNENDSGGEILQEAGDNALSEAQNRSEACGDAYPFELTGQSLQLKQGGDHAPYVFMLLMKQFGLKAGPQRSKPASYFERLSAFAARNYLGGHENGAEIYHFGFPRALSPAGFEDALDDLCKRLAEGTVGRQRPSRRYQKDARLDLVAWKPFNDARRGKIIFFGQCAAGENWDAKTTELVPRRFVSMWMNGNLSTEPLVLFFLPRCLDDEEWDQIATVGTVLPLDRCRIASLLPLSLAADPGDPDALRWTSHVLAGLRVQ